MITSSVSALNIVYQRNGDGEAKSPACRAGVCEAVLHTLKQGTRFSPQVRVQNVMWHFGKNTILQMMTFFSTLVFFRFYGRNSSYVHGGLDPSGKLAEAVYGQAVCVSLIRVCFKRILT